MDPAASSPKSSGSRSCSPQGFLSLDDGLHFLLDYVLDLGLSQSGLYSLMPQERKDGGHSFPG